jgi:tripartite ATP-independent transporter DctP family solute receptor
MRKKSLIFLSGFLIICFVLIGFQSQAMAQKKHVFKLGHSVDEKNSWALMCDKFKEKAEAYGNGAIEVKIFPAAQLGGDAEQVRSVQLGSQDFAAPSISNFSQSVSQLGYFLLPYAFESKEQARKVIAKMSQQNNEWAKKEAGLRILGYLEGGFRVLSNAKKPVEKLEDLQGLRIRVPPNKIMIGAYKSWGIEPIPVPWAETFNALQQGVVDGQDNPYVTILSMKFYEVQKYITEIDYIYNIGVLIIQEKFFQSLPKDIQDALSKAGKDSTEFGYQLNDKGVEKDKEALKEKGMVLLGPPKDKMEWINRAKSTWPEFYEMLGGGDAEKGKWVIKQLEAEK